MGGQGNGLLFNDKGRAKHKCATRSVYYPALAVNHMKKSCISHTWSG